MTHAKRPIAYWVIVSFLALSTVLMLIAQTTPIFDYPLAVRLGFQNGADQISEFGVQVIRAFCVSDTLVFIPLTVIALIGLLLRKRWSLFATASVTGIRSIGSSPTASWSTSLAACPATTSSSA